MGQDDAGDRFQPGQSDRENGGRRLADLARKQWEATQRKLKELDPVKVRKVLKTLAKMSVVVPFVAINIFAIARIIDQAVVVMHSTDMEAPSGGEFDPSMGAEVHSKNGKALVVVHEGFGISSVPWRFNENENYEEYLASLDSRRAIYLEGGDVVVIVQEPGTFASEVHRPANNVVYFVTNPNNGFPFSFVVNNGISYQQSSEVLFDKLRVAGVSKVEMGGEFRGACVSQVMILFKSAGFEIGWCTDCVFPQVEPGELQKYPPLGDN